MQARNEYLIVRLPDRITRRGGIDLPESSKQEFMVGRILSVGEKAKGAWKPGTLVAFDKWVQQHLQLDPYAKEPPLVVVHEDQVYCTLEPGEAESFVFEETETETPWGPPRRKKDKVG